MAFALTTGRQGIQRLRIKGGAKPDTLYDAVNCYVTVSGSIRPREGSSIDMQLPEGTVGLMAYRGMNWVFSDHYIDMAEYPGYGMSVLVHRQADSEATLADIHFAEPFLGYPYVVAEWSDGAIFHYWLQGEGNNPKTWQPDTIYRLNEIIHPNTPNGWTYKATRFGEPGTAWAPNTETAEADVVEPIVANGFEYEAVEVFGNPARTGTVEPTWPTEDGATVVEEADIVLTGETSSTGTGGQVPPDVEDRYGSGN